MSLSPAHPGRAVTFGELLLRLSPPGEERLLASPNFAASFGGAEANVAVGLRHLGVPCDYVTRLPANPIGDAALDALKREGVGTDWVLRGGERMGIYFVEQGADLRAMRVIYDRGASAFAELQPQAVPWPQVLAGATWFHGSGITPALGAGPAQRWRRGRRPCPRTDSRTRTARRRRCRPRSRAGVRCRARWW